MIFAFIIALLIASAINALIEGPSKKRKERARQLAVYHAELYNYNLKFGTAVKCNDKNCGYFNCDSLFFPLTSKYNTQESWDKYYKERAIYLAKFSR